MDNDMDVEQVQQQQQVQQHQMQPSMGQHQPMQMMGQQQNQPMSQKDEYIYKIEEEMNSLGDEYAITKQILETELFRLRGGITDWLDVINNRKVKVRARVAIPTEQFPRVNFVGKLLGPKGATLKSLQEQTMTKMAVLGHGSMRNEGKELEALNSGDPKYKHLKQKLYLQIDSLATPEESYYRLSHALAEVKKVMQPDESEMMMAQQLLQQANNYGMGVGNRGGGGGEASFWGRGGGEAGSFRGRGAGGDGMSFRGRGGASVPEGSSNFRGRGGAATTGGFRGRGNVRGRGGDAGRGGRGGRGGSFSVAGGDNGNMGASYDQGGGGGKMMRGGGAGRGDQSNSHPYSRFNN